MVVVVDNALHPHFHTPLRSNFKSKRFHRHHFPFTNTFLNTPKNFQTPLVTLLSMLLPLPALLLEWLLNFEPFLNHGTLLFSNATDTACHGRKYRTFTPSHDFAPNKQCNFDTCSYDGRHAVAAVIIALLNLPFCYIFASPHRFPINNNAENGSPSLTISVWMRFPLFPFDFDQHCPPEHTNFNSADSSIHCTRLVTFL